MRFDVLTLFPEMFSGYLSQSLLKLAIQSGLVDVRLHNLRDWAKGKHRKVDDRPFGGGPGMVLMVEPVVECVEEVRRVNCEEGAQVQGVLGEEARGEEARDRGAEEGANQGGACPTPDDSPGRLVMLTPQGRRLDQRLVEELAGHKRLILLCGRYEGFDERVRTILAPEEVSIGDFVLNGGEGAAMVVIDTVIRLVPGVLGDEQSSRDDSFSRHDRLLEYAQYTRPREYRGHQVPEVLLSGDHEAIARWRDEQRRLRTRQRRSDLLPDDSSITKGPNTNGPNTKGPSTKGTSDEPADS
jgi:tRNA (guanine37-N1)-methyltransferase